MTKPKPKQASRRFTAYPHQLKPETRSALKQALNNQDDKVIEKVESVLAIGTVGPHHLDEIPRPADYVAKFKPIEKDAIGLLNCIFNLGDYYQEQFEEMGVDINAIEGALINLVNVASGVVGKYRSQPSKGAKRDNARCEVIRRLRIIFHENYRGEVSGRTKMGGFVIRSIEEASEFTFIELALRDARLISQSYAGLDRLIKDSRCAIPSDRARIVDKIARNGNKVRLSEENVKQVTSKKSKSRTAKKGLANAR